MRPTKKPYEVSLSTSDAQIAFVAICKLFRELGEVPEPQPRLKAWELAFSSSVIAWGPRGQVDVGGKFVIELNFEGLGYGVAPHALKALLFNEHVNADIVKAVQLTMMYIADVEAKGLNEVNEQLVSGEIGKLYELFGKSCRLLGLE
jgi:hypothetical protein